MKYVVKQSMRLLGSESAECRRLEMWLQSPAGLSPSIAVMQSAVAAGEREKTAQMLRDCECWTLIGDGAHKGAVRWHPDGVIARIVLRTREVELRLLGLDMAAWDDEVELQKFRDLLREDPHGDSEAESAAGGSRKKRITTRRRIKSDGRLELKQRWRGTCELWQVMAILWR